MMFQRTAAGALALCLALPAAAEIKVQDAYARAAMPTAPTGAAFMVLENTGAQDDRLMLATIRSHDQYNTTIYGLNDRYRGIKNERRVVFINPADMKKRGWQARQQVNIINEHGGKKRVAEAFLLVPYDIPEGCLGAYFPEANVLVPIDSYAEHSLTPASKRIVVKLEES